MTASENPRSSTPVLLVVGIGTFLASLATSAANLALPDIGREFTISIAQSHWVVQVYLLTVGTLLLLAGRISDLIGHRRVYLTGFILFGLGSLGCGLAPGFELLLIARVLQGVGGALSMATAPALLTLSVAPQNRGKALGLLGTATYLGLTLGPPLGGFVIAHLGWRWCFFLNVPLALLVLALGFWKLPAGSRSVNEFQLERESKAGGEPLLPLGLFRSRVFVGSVLSAVLNYAALFVPNLLLPFFLEEGLSLTQSTTGMVLTAQPLVMALVASPAGWLSDRYGSRGLATCGMLVLSAGMAGLSTLGGGSQPVSVVLWLSLVGLGTGIFISPNSSALMGEAPREKQGSAGSLLAEARILGMMLGVALAKTVYQLQDGQTGKSWQSVDFHAAQVAFLVAAGVALAGALAASLRGPKSASHPGRDVLQDHTK